MKWGDVAEYLGIGALFAGGAYMLTQSGPTQSDDEATVNALGRMLASEAANQTIEERTAIAYSALNTARKHRKSFVQMSYGKTGGGFGPQNEGGRPWSTNRSARPQDLSLARQILSSYPSGDITNGGTAFFEPKAQDQLFKQGLKGYKHDAQGIRDKWTSEGMRLTASVGRWEFYA